MTNKEIFLSEVREAVFNTMDFCGNVREAVRQVCDDYNAQLEGAVEEFMFACIEDYHDEANRIRYELSKPVSALKLIK